MITLVRLIRVALILVLALFAVSFVMGIGTSTTGWVEKLALLGLIAMCVYLAARVSFLAERVQTRLRRH